MRRSAFGGKKRPGLILQVDLSLDNGGVALPTRVPERVPDDGAELTSIFSGRLRIASGGLITLITMIAFEAMAVGPALPTAARELHGLSAFGWAFTAFLVANVLGMVVAGQLSDAHGPRLPMVAGIVLFLAGLAIAGTATHDGAARPLPRRAGPRRRPADHRFATC